MSLPHGNPDDLERFVDQALRGVGQRQAPRTLESRVLAELARRAALPWWRRHFAHWPLAAQAAFLIASIGFVRLAFVAVTWAFAAAHLAHLTDLSTQLMVWIGTGAHLASTLTDLAVSLVGRIPSQWLYAGLVFGALLYGALFGLGAVGYRLLCATPNTRGLPQ